MTDVATVQSASARLSAWCDDEERAYRVGGDKSSDQKSVAVRNKSKWYFDSRMPRVDSEFLLSTTTSMFPTHRTWAIQPSSKVCFELVKIVKPSCILP